MVLKREVIKEIEYHFYNYEKEKKQIEEIASDIAEASSYVLDLSGVHGSGKSDPTAQRAELIEKKCGKVRRWIKVVEAALKYFENDPRGELARRYYFKNESVTSIQNRLYISERTFYAWKADVINYAALKACETGLVKI